ncbi:Eukaryotic translation initiation factor 5A-1 [Nymphaea thermarum]|nr:Eukaryotic translation initiation factor 5A-1 [Nymphaea thermarum]
MKFYPSGRKSAPAIPRRRAVRGVRARDFEGGPRPPTHFKEENLQGCKDHYQAHQNYQVYVPPERESMENHKEEAIIKHSEGSSNQADEYMGTKGVTHGTNTNGKDDIVSSSHHSDGPCVTRTGVQLSVIFEDEYGFVGLLNHSGCNKGDLQLFTHQKQFAQMVFFLSSHHSNVPCVTRIDYQLIVIFKDGFVNLLTEREIHKDDI